MAMKRTAGSTRRPPELSESHAEIEDWMRHVMPDLNPIVTRLDELIRQTHPDVRFAVKWKKAYYGLADVGWMMEVVAYDVSVNVGEQPVPRDGDRVGQRGAGGEQQLASRQGRDDTVDRDTRPPQHPYVDVRQAGALAIGLYRGVTRR